MSRDKPPDANKLINMGIGCFVLCLVCVGVAYFTDYDFFRAAFGLLAVCLFLMGTNALVTVIRILHDETKDKKDD